MLTLNERAELSYAQLGIPRRLLTEYVEVLEAFRSDLLAELAGQRFVEWRTQWGICIGYPDCDGDLVAEPHSDKCPLSKAGPDWHLPTLQEAYAAGAASMMVFIGLSD